jgi:hypothetical protein
MNDALDARERAHGGLAPWVVGRFVVPAARLGELRHALEIRGASLAASVIVDGTEPIARALANLAREARAAAHVVAVESIECALAPIAAPNDDGRVAAFEAALGGAGFAPPPAAYLEVPLAQSLMERAVASLCAARSRGFEVAAKIRCGGLDASAVPAAEQVARFIRAACDAALPFKATAGLHHALPREDANIGATTHGFLNLTGAAVFARAHELDDETLARLLGERDPAQFVLDETSLRWRELTSSAAEIARVRTSFFHSYGSCSLAEPVEDLRILGMLERATA